MVLRPLFLAVTLTGSLRGCDSSFAVFHVFLRYNRLSCGPKAAASSASCTGKLINSVEGKRRIHLPPASKGAGSKERKAINKQNTFICWSLADLTLRIYIAIYT